MNISINRNQLKYIAIVAMVIDHIAWAFLPITSVPSQLMHFVGRLTGPIMAYMLAEGYIHTRNFKKYAIRMFVFAVISWIPYSLHEEQHWPSAQFGVIYTLFLALIAIRMWDKLEAGKGAKIFLVVFICILSLFGDWPIFDILWPLFLFIYKDDPKKKWRSFIIVMVVEVLLVNLLSITGKNPFSQVFQFGAFLTLPILMKFYNGEPGNRSAFHKWFFYVFYPLHLLILALMQMYL